VGVHWTLAFIALHDFNMVVIRVLKIVIHVLDKLMRSHREFLRVAKTSLIF
jgi:hypothetical protein